MTIPAKYENGVFKPLAEVTLTEGAQVEVYVPSDAALKPQSVRELGIFGMWADREDIKDSVAFVNKIRSPRGE